MHTAELMPLGDVGGQEGVPVPESAVEKAIADLEQALARETFSDAGSLELRIGLGGMAVSVRLPDSPSFREAVVRLAARYNAFVSSATPRLVLRVIQKTDLDPGPFFTPSVRSMHPVHYALRYDFRVRLDISRSEGRAVVGPQDVTMAVDSLIRIAYSFLITRSGGLLMHASSVRSRDGRGFVFMGQSGAGKSTVAALLQAEADALTDEISLIRMDGSGNRAMVCGTPFCGTLGKGLNAAAPTALFCRLCQAKETRLVAVSPPRAAVSRLMQNVVLYAGTAQYFAEALDTCIAVQRRVPVLDLYFEKNLNFWRSVLEYGGAS